MKILHIHPDLSVKGGIETMILVMSNEMCKSHDVTACSIYKFQRENEFFNKFDSRVRQETIGATKNDSPLRAVFRTLKYIFTTNADIIHIHGFFYYYALPVILLHKHRTFIYTLHSDAFMENSKWDKKIFFIKKFCIKHKWVHPVTISPKSKESFHKLYKSDSTMILNGIAKSEASNCADNIIQKSKITDNTKIFLHPGRISTPKNQYTLCKVFQRLIDEGEDISLLIAGTIQDNDIFNQISDFFSPRIKYLGERNDIPQLFAHSDGFCLPSLWEGLPVTLLEALSVGCIPVCAPVGGIVNVITDMDNGLLSVSSSEEDYYNCMKRFLALSPQQRESISKNGMKSFEKYDIATTAKCYIDLYDTLSRKR